MPIFTVRHVTTYRYRRPLAFGEHRMMLRPRESYDQRLVEARLDIQPKPKRLRWINDVFGNTVEIRHPNGFVTRYAHLRAFRAEVQLGTRLHQSDVIGYVGMTGLASGPHLHYEMLQRNGRQMDPLSVDLPAGDPVPSDARDRWELERSGRMSLLETIPPAGPVRTAVAELEPEPMAPTPADDRPAEREADPRGGVQ